MVADIDATVRKAQSLGGRVHGPRREIPDAGCLAVLSDPQGAFFSVIQWRGQGTEMDPG